MAESNSNPPFFDSDPITTAGSAKRMERAVKNISARVKWRWNFLIRGVIVVVFLMYTKFFVHFKILSNIYSSMKQAMPVSPDADENRTVSHLVATKRMIPIYTEELAKLAVRPSSWQCVSGDDADPKRRATNDDTIFAFIHVYKTAGSTMRSFFRDLAYACGKTWVLLAECTEVLPSSIQSRGPWEPCKVKQVTDGRGRKKTLSRTAGIASNPRFEVFVDIFGGHMRLGTGDYIFNDSPTWEGVRYIVFLRDPVERFVSGILYQNKLNGFDESLEQVVTKIKHSIVTARKNDKYWDKSLDYLLTPVQSVKGNNKSNSAMSSIAASPSSQAWEARALQAVHNLHNYNVIIGMTERMPESLAILRHVYAPENSLNDKAEAVFERFGLVTPLTNDRVGNHTASSVSKGEVRANQSSRNNVSTTAVIAELAKDEGIMLLMEEYVKYERMITDFAWTMHTLQYDSAMRGGGNR
jgi:hypothetical protein